MIRHALSANGVGEVDVNIEDAVAPAEVDTRAARFLRMTDMTVVGCS